MKSYNEAQKNRAAHIWSTLLPYIYSGQIALSGTKLNDLAIEVGRAINSEDRAWKIIDHYGGFEDYCNRAIDDLIRTDAISDDDIEVEQYSILIEWMMNLPKEYKEEIGLSHDFFKWEPSGKAVCMAARNIRKYWNAV